MLQRRVWQLSAVVFAVVMAALAFRNPIYDWDMLAYAAIQHKWQGFSDEQTHQKIYNDLLPSLDSTTQKLLVTKAFEIKCQHSTVFFIEQLPFYTVKPLYNALIFMFGLCGLNLVQSMQLVSSFAYAALIVCLFVLLSSRIDERFALLFTVIISLLSPVWLTARMLTPDMLSAAFIVGAGVAYIVFNRFHFAMTLFVLSIEIRPDNVVVALAASFLFTIFLSPRHRMRTVVLFATLSLVAYVIATFGFAGYGWKITFQHSVIDLTKPVEHWQQTPFSLGDYFAHLLKAIQHYQLLLIPMLFWAILGLFATASLVKQNVFDKKLVALVTVLLIAIAIKSLAFPRFDVRYNTSQYVFAAALVAITIVSTLRTKNLAS